MVHDILRPDHIQWHPQSIRHYTNLWTYYRTGPYYRCWPYCQISGGFHKTLQWVRLANRLRLLLRTPGPVPFGTCICFNDETIFCWACHDFGLWVSNNPRYFYFASVWSAGMVGGQVGKEPKCCSSLTKMDTILGMMQGYKDEITNLNARVAQLESGGQQQGMASYSEQLCRLMLVRMPLIHRFTPLQSFKHYLSLYALITLD